jgi:uncharacterized membrane protein YciS (DUF1049 family)
MVHFHTSTFLIIFFSGATLGAAIAIYIYRKLSPRVCAIEKKISCALDDLKK